MKHITNAGLTDKLRPPESKVCQVCKIEKPIKEFVMDFKNKGNHAHYCRSCKKEKEDKKKEQQKEYAKKYFTF